MEERERNRQRRIRLRSSEICHTIATENERDGKSERGAQRERHLDDPEAKGEEVHGGEHQHDKEDVVLCQQRADGGGGVGGARHGKTKRRA